MNLIKLNINEVLLLDQFNFHNPYNNIDHLNKQASKGEKLDEQLSLLSLAAHKIEKFHSFFHFEQSYFHLQLAILYRNIGDYEKAKEQLELAIFQDHLNKQAKSMLAEADTKELYDRPYKSFADYVSFATDEEGGSLKSQGYWRLSQDSVQDLQNIIDKIRYHHLRYHEEAAKLYLNRSLIFYLLKQPELAKNDIVKAHNLDNKLAQKEYYSMVMSQMRVEIVLGLGSNLGDREKFLRDSIAKLQEFMIIEDVTCSTIIESEADLLPNSPKEWDLKYLNMAIRGTTAKTPEELLKSIENVEQIIGTKANAPWSPREIDIDILAYGNEVINQKDFQIPHARLLERPWAMGPFAEIWPGWIHPAIGKTINELYNEQSKISRHS